MDAWINYRKISRWLLTAFFCAFALKAISDLLILFLLPLGNYQARLQRIAPFGTFFLAASLACTALLKLAEYHYLGSLVNLRAEKGYAFRITTPADMLEFVKSDSPQFKNAPDPEVRGRIYRRSLKLRYLPMTIFCSYTLFYSAILLSLCRGRFG